MTVLLVSVYDALSGFSELRQAVSSAAAIRSFGDAVRESKLISSHVNDFSFYALGTLDLDSGIIEPMKQYLCGASDFLNGDVEIGV